ncbi:MAG: AAA family ATPase [Actinomycetota bacterium]|nr:AAA family ATPase [Actinomycetota bacterium]
MTAVEALVALGTMDTARVLFGLEWNPIPLPAGRKTPPPDGVTGWRGRYTTPADLERQDWDWSGNLAIRLPPDVIGLDVDVYHGGGGTLDALEARLGPLPKTIWSTSGRDDGSGIGLFRVPVGTVFVSALPGIELIQASHRYVVCAPSLHPEGRRYRWFDEAEDDEVEFPPAPGDLPELPWAWLAELRSEKMAGATAALPERCAEFIAQHTEAQQPAAVKGLRQRLDTYSGSRHDMLVTAACWAFREVAAGWYAASTAVDELGRWWRRVMDDPARRDGGEFDAALAWAVGQLDTPAGREQVAAKRVQLVERLEPVGSIERPSNVDGSGEIHDIIPYPVVTIGAMARAVDAAPPPSFVVQRLLVAGDYGVLGAEKKFGKTFAVGDMAVNVAAGGAFLGAFPVDHAGPVLLFAGEGGQRKLVRRFRAIADHYDINIDRLPLHIYERAPKLADAEQVARLAATVEQVAPVLVIIDPAYLALAGAETSNLASMGVLLERIQLITQAAGAALLMSHHWNKTGVGTAADRFTGAGFAEWGRVLLSGATLSRNTHLTTMATTAVCKLEVVGDEIADHEITYRRRVWVDDPNDLTSAMHYSVELVDNATPPELNDAPGMKPAAARVLAVLRAAAGAWFDHVQIGDRLADDGHPLKKRTILEAGQALVEAGLADESGGVGAIRKTFRAHPGVGNVL